MLAAESAHSGIPPWQHWESSGPRRLGCPCLGSRPASACVRSFLESAAACEEQVELQSLSVFRKFSRCWGQAIRALKKKDSSTGVCTHTHVNGGRVPEPLSGHHSRVAAWLSAQGAGCWLLKPFEFFLSFWGTLTNYRLLGRASAKVFYKCWCSWGLILCPKFTFPLDLEIGN